MEEILLISNAFSENGICEGLVRNSLDFSRGDCAFEKLHSFRWQLFLGTQKNSADIKALYSSSVESSKMQCDDWNAARSLYEDFEGYPTTASAQGNETHKVKNLKFDESSSESDSDEDFKTGGSVNPLRPGEHSYYDREQKYRVLKREIGKDVDRLFWDIPLFDRQSTRRHVEQLLLAYCLKFNREYRQGMHEIAAMCYYSVYRDTLILEKVDENILKGQDKEIYNVISKSLQHLFPTVFAIFCAIMDSEKGLGLSRFFFQEDSGGQSSVLICAERVQQDILLTLDSPLQRLLDAEYNIHSATYMIRWLRLLFIREFAFSEVLQLWDVILAERYIYHCKQRVYLLENSFVPYFAACMIIHVRTQLLKGAEVAFRTLMKYPTTNCFSAIVSQGVISSNGVLQPYMHSTATTVRSLSFSTNTDGTHRSVDTRKCGEKLVRIIDDIEKFAIQSTKTPINKLENEASFESCVFALAELKKMRDIFLYDIQE